MYVYKNIYFVAVLLCALRQLDRFRTHIFTEFFARSQASQDLFKQLGAPSSPMGFPHGKTMGKPWGTSASHLVIGFYP